MFYDGCININIDFQKVKNIREIITPFWFSGEISK